MGALKTLGMVPLALVANSLQVQASADQAYIQTDRYTLARLAPEPYQVDLFSQPVSIRYSQKIKTIGEALLELLSGSGYQLSPKHVYQKALYAQELPEVHRAIGPLPLKEALAVLAGKAWTVGVDNLNKTVFFELSDAYLDREEEVLDILGQQMVSEQPEAGTTEAGTAIVEVIPFGVGIYEKLGPRGTEATENLVVKLNDTDGKIYLTGYAQSRSNLANEGLAHQRARLIAEVLIARGISPDRIEIDTHVTNHVSGKVLHQVEAKTMKTGSYTVATSLEGDDLPMQRCGKIAFTSGSMKENITRALSDCEHTLGRWEFGETNYELDWKIPKEFELYLSGMLPFLRFLRQNYGVDHRVNQIDATVDFFPYVDRQELVTERMP